MKIDWVAYEEGRYAASQYRPEVSREKNPYPQGGDSWKWRGKRDEQRCKQESSHICKRWH